jgi:hypothetical protein
MVQLRDIMQEPTIIINGVQLTTAQAMTLRVAISGFNPDCGNDEHWKFMTAAYRARQLEIFKLMGVN